MKTPLAVVNKIVKIKEFGYTFKKFAKTPFNSITNILRELENLGLLC